MNARMSSAAVSKSSAALGHRPHGVAATGVSWGSASWRSDFTTRSHQLGPQGPGGFRDLAEPLAPEVDPAALPARAPHHGLNGRPEPVVGIVDDEPSPLDPPRHQTAEKRRPECASSLSPT